MPDTFKPLNELNNKTQGKNENIRTCSDKLKSLNRKQNSGKLSYYGDHWKCFHEAIEIEPLAVYLW